MYRPALRPLLTCYAALLLVVQLLLTAGHLHVPAFHGDEYRLAASTDHDAPGPPFHDEDHCPLCWAQIASGASIIPPATALPLPPGPASLPRAAIVREPAAITRPGAFQPRAPPLPLSA